jgi:arylsulfatase B
MKSRSVIFSLSVSLALVAAIYHFQSNTISKPNVVIIVADDMGWADVGYHSARVQTPNLDQLSSEGVELDRFYVAPTCTPTRAGLLTGRYPIRFGMGRSALPPYRKFGLPAAEVTLAESLAERGYEERGAFGKWHLGHLESRWHPLSNGFTEFEGHYNGAIDYFSHKFFGEPDWHANYEPVAKEGYSTDLIAQAATSFIDTAAKGDSPYLAYVAFNSPHTPHQAKAEDLAKFKVAPELDAKTALVTAMIWSLDKSIGDVLDAIDNSGESENTIVWFMSDNGGAKGITGNNAPLSGYKRGVFEGGIRVPSIVRWPGRWDGGRKITDTVGYVDIFPTIVAQAEPPIVNGAGTSLDLDGIDLSPLFDGSKGELPARDWYTYIGQDDPVNEWMAVKSGNWKLIVYGPRIDAHGLGKKHLVALYDIESDPSEKNDLSPKYGGRIRLLAKKLAEHRSLQPPEAIPHYMYGSEKPFEPPKNWRIIPGSSH